MSESAELRVGVIGATGLVGRAVVAILAERAFPVGELRLWGSVASDGAEVEFGDDARRAEALPRDLPPLDVAFLCAPAEVSRPVGEALALRGTIVVDVSGCAAPAAPEPEASARPTASRGVVLPVLPALARMVVSPVAALSELAALRRVSATFLAPAASFGGREVERLSRQTVSLLSGQGVESAADDEAESAPAAEIELAFNSLPETNAEWARRLEDAVRSALDVEIAISLSLARVPTFHGHAVSLAVETTEPIPVARALACLRAAPSIVVAEPSAVPVGTLDTPGGDALFVASLRVDPRDPRWLQAWLLADAVRWGAALPAVSLAEKAIARRG